jgi:hypothetical protein
MLGPIMKEVSWLASLDQIDIDMKSKVVYKKLPRLRKNRIEVMQKEISFSDTAKRDLASQYLFITLLIYWQIPEFVIMDKFKEKLKI